MTEIYFAPTRKAAPVTLAQLQQRFIDAGLPCTIEEDSVETCWFSFEPHESTIYASIEGDLVMFATLNFGFKDDPKVLAIVEGVMDAINFSADEDADYA